jgi:hypothetical protein
VVFAFFFALIILELIAYGALLARLSRLTKEKRPALSDALGAPGPWDYLMWGFGPGDRFISKLESHSDQIAQEPELLRLMRQVRSVYVAFLLTVLVWTVVIVSHAN